MFRRRTFLAAAVAVPVAGTLTPGLASADSGAFPTTLALPNGFQPEGITIGPGPFAYFGSLADGRILRVNLINGTSRVLSPAVGTPSVGLKTDGRRLFVSGGPAGNARVVDQRSGEVLATYQLATGQSFINDVILTRDAAWFTNSFAAALYALPLHHGRLPAQADLVTLPLTGEFVQGPGFNANGIERTPDGRALLIVQSNTATLFRVNPKTGDARKVDLGGEPLTNGDGLLVIGRTLFVVQNRLNRIAVFRLNSAGTSGTLTTHLTAPGLDVPTTVAAFGNRLYLPNARFTTPPTPTTPYTAVAIRR